ncbi:MAG: glycosyltransferase family 2 protein [Pseudomonadota bacterium]|nr:glycosyltransferase family 2 protein [Pseudomonadota bacterium]
MSQNFPHRFTVFTPTYNRAHTLLRVYESLKIQTYKNFEWLIVDDGSSDGTAGMVEQWQEEDSLTIRYFYQENQGKHVAFNRGVLEAQGNLFLTLDSDDTCVSNALERFVYHWQGIPVAERENFSGVTCLCMDAEGKVVGTRFPLAVMDADLITFTIRYKQVGDKWGFHRTDILRQYPFPIFFGERFVPEGVVWNRIGRKFKLRFIDEPLRICEYLSDGLTASIIRLRARNPLGVRCYYFEYLQLAVPFRYRWKAIINYFRFSAHAGMPPLEALRDLGNFLEGLLLLPAGYLFYLADCWAIKK